MTLARRAFVAALATPAFARAQTYPDRPIRFLIPLAAGSAVDVVARLVAEKMGEILGQRVFVENEPGAAGLIGMRWRGTGAQAVLEAAVIPRWRTQPDDIGRWPAASGPGCGSEPSGVRGCRRGSPGLELAMWPRSAGLS